MGSAVLDGRRRRLALLLVSSVLAGSVLPTPISDDPTRTRTASTGPRSSPTRSHTATRSSPLSRPAASSTAARATSPGRPRRMRAGPGRRACSRRRRSTRAGRGRGSATRSVAYDPEHDVWMISTLAFGMGATPFGAPSAILTSRSTDGGLTWQAPVTMSIGPSSFYDKNWIVCDTWPSSPHYGNCYTEWDDTGLGNRILMSTSTDGGLTWGPAISPGGLPSGLGGQPVVQPNGTSSCRTARTSERSGPFVRERRRDLDERGARCESQHPHRGRRPSRTAAAVGRGRRLGEGLPRLARLSVPVGCTANDIVMTTTTDGFVWSPVMRIPIDPVNERRRPLHPRNRRRPVHVRRAPRGWLSRTTTTRSAAAREHVRSHRRLRLLARRRRDLDAADAGQRADEAVAGSRRRARGAWSPTTSRPRSRAGTPCPSS